MKWNDKKGAREGEGAAPATARGRARALAPASGGPQRSRAEETGVVGLVFDGATGLPVAGARVERGGQGAETDAFGAFSLGTPAGTEDLRVSGPGGLGGTIADVENSASSRSNSLPLQIPRAALMFRPKLSTTM